MVVKIKLKNADKHLLLDHEIFEKISAEKYFREMKVLDNIREHSSGVPVFQKYIDMVNGKCKVESIYLASYIAIRYIPKPETATKRMYLSYLNGDKLDLRLKNMRWEKMNKLSRQRTTSHNKTGFRGVRKTPQGKYVSMISDGVKQIYLGSFLTAQDAALAYNKKSIELFGITANLNKLDNLGRPVRFEYTTPKENHAERIRKPRKHTALAKPMMVSTFNLLPVLDVVKSKSIRKVLLRNIA